MGGGLFLFEFCNFTSFELIVFSFAVGDNDDDMCLDENGAFQELESISIVVAGLVHLFLPLLLAGRGLPASLAVLDVLDWCEVLLFVLSIGSINLGLEIFTTCLFVVVDRLLVVVITGGGGL